MLRANIAIGNLSILLPMITSIDEIDEARQFIDLAGREVEDELGYVLPKPRIGIMVKVPAMVFMLPALVNRVDFLSIGTNDLMQYLLAVDRNNTRVAAMYDSLHSAMLQVLQKIISESARLGLACNLCGEMAGDSIGALLLAGMGYRTLSMNGLSVVRIKYLLRNVALNEAQRLASLALSEQNSIEVRHLVTAFMEQRGLDGLIRGWR